jgi:hypothetical protein
MALKRLSLFGCSPVKSSQRMDPKAKTSVAGVQGSPVSCSTAHHGIEAPYASATSKVASLSREKVFAAEWTFREGATCLLCPIASFKLATTVVVYLEYLHADRKTYPPSPLSPPPALPVKGFLFYSALKEKVRKAELQQLSLIYACRRGKGGGSSESQRSEVFGRKSPDRLDRGWISETNLDWKSLTSHF